MNCSLFCLFFNYMPKYFHLPPTGFFLSSETYLDLSSAHRQLRMHLYYPACSLASQVIIIILLFSVLVMHPGACKLLHFKTLFLILFQPFHPQIPLSPRQSRQKWPPTLSRPMAEFQLQVCAGVRGRALLKLSSYHETFSFLNFFLHRIPCLH